MILGLSCGLERLDLKTRISSPPHASFYVPLTPSRNQIPARRSPSSYAFSILVIFMPSLQPTILARSVGPFAYHLAQLILFGELAA